MKVTVGPVYTHTAMTQSSWWVCMGAMQMSSYCNLHKSSCAFVCSLTKKMNQLCDYDVKSVNCCLKTLQLELFSSKLPQNVLEVVCIESNYAQNHLPFV